LRIKVKVKKHAKSIKRALLEKVKKIAIITITHNKQNDNFLNLLFSDIDLIANLKIKIKGPGIKASYGGFSYLFMHYINPFTFLEGNLAIKSLKEDISEKYKREINREFLEQLVNEAIIPYEPKNY